MSKFTLTFLYVVI